MEAESTSQTFEYCRVETRDHCDSVSRLSVSRLERDLVQESLKLILDLFRFSPRYILLSRTSQLVMYRVQVLLPLFPIASSIKSDTLSHLRQPHSQILRRVPTSSLLKTITLSSTLSFRSRSVEPLHTRSQVRLSQTARLPSNLIFFRLYRNQLHLPTVGSITQRRAWYQTAHLILS